MDPLYSEIHEKTIIHLEEIKAMKKEVITGDLKKQFQFQASMFDMSFLDMGS